VSVNPHQVRALVAAQLRLDLRHPKTGRMQTSRAALTVASYAFSSLILAFSLAERGVSLPEFVFAALSFTAVLAAFGVAGSYDDLMGRPRDAARMLTFPVSERTLYAARLANVGLFAVAMSLSAALPLAVAGGLLFGGVATITVGGALVAMMLVVTFTVLAAVWTLTLVAPIRAQRPVLSATRAVLIGALVLGYQWVATQETLLVEAAWWPAHWVIAAGWGGALWAWTALVATTLGLGIAFGWAFAPRYARVLERTAEAENLRSVGRGTKPAPNRWERWALLTPEARAAYGFATSALSSDRVVRGRTWPAALLAFVFAGFAWWTGSLGDLFAHGAHNVLFDPAIQMHLSVVTVLLFVALTAVQAVQVSDQIEASWAFDVLPVRSTRALQVGAQQALVGRVLVPLHIALAILLALSMPLLHAVLHAAFWLAGCALLTRLYAVTRSQAPFSQQSDRFSAGQRFLPLLLAVPMSLGMLLVQAVAFTHPGSATLMIAGLFFLHAALGRVGASARQPLPTPTLQPAFERA
jgi:hypothetical protein